MLNDVEQRCSSGRSFLTSLSAYRPQGNGLFWSGHATRYV